MPYGRKLHVACHCPGFHCPGFGGQQGLQQETIGDPAEGGVGDAHAQKTPTYEPFWAGGNSRDEEGKLSTFDQYLEEISKDTSWLGNLELEAASRLFGITCYVIPQAIDQVPVKHGGGAFPIAFYYSGSHYDYLQPQGSKGYPPAILNIEEVGSRTGGRGGGDDASEAAFTVYTEDSRGQVITRKVGGNAQQLLGPSPPPSSSSSAPPRSGGTAVVFDGSFDTLTLYTENSAGIPKVKCQRRASGQGAAANSGEAKRAGFDCLAAGAAAPRAEAQPSEEIKAEEDVDSQDLGDIEDAPAPQTHGRVKRAAPCKGDLSWNLAAVTFAPLAS